VFYVVIQKISVTFLRHDVNSVSAGCFAHGLFLEGAAWDLQTNNIIRQQPKQMIQSLPVLKITPIESHRLKLQVSGLVVYVTVKTLDLRW